MFSWNENVALCLLEKLGSIDLTFYVMDILKKKRRDYLEEEAREWHSSLRINQEERWKRIKDLSMKRKFHRMNMSVPISCTLPFDGGMWRNSRDMLAMIQYFRDNFIKRRVQIQVDGYLPGTWIDKTANIRDKARLVNNAFNKDAVVNGYFGQWTSRSMEEALGDYINFTEDPKPDIPYNELPYLCEIDLFKEEGGELINNGVVLEIVN